MCVTLLQVLQVLRRSTYPITLAIDGWTNVRHEKVTNLVVLCHERYYQAAAVCGHQSDLVMLKHSRWDSRKFWNLYFHTVPELAQVSIAILSIAATEACVERTFSTQDSIHSKKRNKLGNDIIEAEMVINFNKRALDPRI